MRASRDLQASVRRGVPRAIALGLLTTVAAAWIAQVCYQGERKYEIFARHRDAAHGEGRGTIAVERAWRRGITCLESNVSPPGNAAFEDLASTGPSPDKLAAWEQRLVLPWRRGRAPWPGPVGYAGVQAVAVGWPFRALWHEYRYVPALDPAQTDPSLWSSYPRPEAFETPGGVRLWGTTSFGILRREMPLALSYQPIVDGLAADATLYSAAWLGMVLLVRSARQWRRRRRGLCPSCAYELFASPEEAPCQECGLTRVAVDEIEDTEKGHAPGISVINQ